MLIISVEITKTIDEREMQKTNKDRNEQGEQKLYWNGESKGVLLGI